MNSGLKSILGPVAVCLLLAATLTVTEAAESPTETRKTLTSALTGKFPPFSFYGPDGELTGFDVDVSRDIAHRIGREPKIVTTEWDGILAGLLAGKYDAIIGSMAVTPKRAEKVAFSSPYYHSGAQLFVHRENPQQVYSIEECSGKRIAVVLGETYQHYLESTYPAIEVVTLKSTAEIFELLQRHRIAGFVTDQLVGTWQIKQANRPFVPVGPLLYTEDIAIPVRLEDTQLLSKINEALDAMRNDGSLQRIHNRYFRLTESSETAAQNQISAWIITKKLLQGFAVTLAVAAASILMGFCLSVPCGLLLIHKNGLFFIPHLITRTIVDFLRGTPVLIQLLFVWMGLGLTPYLAAVITLGINAMAYMAEVIRAGLMSVGPGQTRAAQALGLTKRQRFIYVIWPQAFRIAIPPLMNSVVALTKDTALIAVISIPEVIRQAQSIISITFNPSKYYFITAALFFAVTFPLMKLAGRLEAKIKRKGFAHD